MLGAVLAASSSRVAADPCVALADPATASVWMRRPRFPISRSGVAPMNETSCQPIANSVHAGFLSTQPGEDRHDIEGGVEGQVSGSKDHHLSSRPLAMSWACTRTRESRLSSSCSAETRVESAGGSSASSGACRQSASDSSPSSGRLSSSRPGVVRGVRPSIGRRRESAKRLGEILDSRETATRTRFAETLQGGPEL